MTLWKLSSRTALCGAVVALSACGGGGGGGGGGSSADFNEADYPEPPSLAGSGLTEPTRTLTGTQDEARELLVNLRDAFPNVKVAVALQALGKVVNAGGAVATGSGSFACPAGGTVAYVDGSYTANACQVDGYTFDGPATLVIAASGQTLTLGYDALAVNGNVISNFTAAGQTECQLTGTVVGSCVSRYPTGSSVEAENFVWGWDSTWTGTLAGGTHQCGCTRTWNVTYQDFSTTSGKATILGSNGVAYIDRVGQNTFNIWTYVDGKLVFHLAGFGLAS